MGFATIISGGTDGRYTIQADYGEAQRAALVAAVNTALSIVGGKITEQQAKVNEAADREAAQTARVQDAFAAFQAAANDLPPGSPYPSTKAYEFEVAALRKLQMQHEPLRITLRSLQRSKSRLEQQLITWTNMIATVTKQAWCCDLTEDGTGIVATVDINGESDLTLIAPACRPWIAGDGRISTAVKTAGITSRQARAIGLQAKVSELQAKIEAAQSEEQTLAAAVDTAKSTYSSAPTYANWNALTAATAALTEKRTDLSRMVISRASLNSQISAVQKEITEWTAKPSSDSPVAGDGELRARELLSPEQAYFNAAMLPGWQKFKPTYRWGTITYKNESLNLVNVALATATSSAQTSPRLNINQSPELNGVPVAYMDCNSEAFDVGDRCVVQFEAQDWERPVVIGFLDNPKACPIRTTFRVVRTVVVEGVVNASSAGALPANFYLSGVGYREATNDLADGAAYDGDTYEATSRHYLVQSSKLDGGVYTYYDSLTVPGGNIAGSDVGISAQLLYFPLTTTVQATGYASIVAQEEISPGVFQYYYQRAFPFFWIINSPESLISGEDESPITTDEAAAHAWVPTSQTWRFLYTTEIRDGVVIPVYMDVVFTLVSGGGPGTTAVLSIDSWTRVT